VTTRNIIIPPPRYPGGLSSSVTFSVKLVGQNDSEVYVADIDNNALIVGEGLHTITSSPYTLTLTTQDSLPIETWWKIEIPKGCDNPQIYKVQIAAGAEMTWNDFIQAGAPVDPESIWEFRLLPLDANTGQFIRWDGEKWSAIDPPAGTGDMQKLIYDPRDISADVYDLSNFTGNLDGGVF
jgi:hypothetical protein